MGTFTDQLAFDVKGGDRPVSLPITGTCDHPHISADYRNVFYRKVREYWVLAFEVYCLLCACITARSSTTAVAAWVHCLFSA